MKKLSIKNFIVIVSFFLFSCISMKSSNAQERVVVGEIQNGKPKITMDLDLIKYNLEYFFKKNRIDENLTSFEIVQEGGIYGLYAINSESTFKILVELELIEGRFSQPLSKDKTTTTVSCSGCVLGCHVKWYAGNWCCLPLCDPCTKTETVTVQQIFFNEKASY